MLDGGKSVDHESRKQLARIKQLEAELGLTKAERDEWMRRAGKAEAELKSRAGLPRPALNQTAPVGAREKTRLASVIRHEGGSQPDFSWWWEFQE